MPGTTPGRDLYDAALSALRNHVDGLGVSLAIWEARRQDGPDAHARRCANDAMDAIDGAIRELHAIRAQLTGEIRADDDATAARVDALLAEHARNHDIRPGPADRRQDASPGKTTLRRSPGLAGRRARY